MQSPENLPPTPDHLRTRLYGLLAIILVGLAVPVLVAVWCYLWTAAVWNIKYLMVAVSGA